MPDTHYAIGLELSISESCGPSSCSISVYAVDKKTVEEGADAIAAFAKENELVHAECFRASGIDLSDCVRRMKRFSFQLGMRFITDEGLVIETEKP